MGLRQVVGRNVRALRLQRGLSQEELADSAGLNRNYVGMVERAENAATVDTLERLAIALGVPPAELVDRGARPAVRPDTRQAAK